MSGAGAHAQAFGLRMGDTIACLDIVEANNSLGTFQVRPPKPNPLFEEYSVLAAPLQGVCFVIASAEALSMTDWVRFNRQIVPVLQEKYGEPRFEPEIPQYVFGDLVPQDLHSVTLSYSPPNVFLAYRFANIVDCGAELSVLYQNELGQGL